MTVIIIDSISYCRNTTNHYILNGNWKIDFAGSYDFAGTTFVYERLSPLGEKAKKKKSKVIIQSVVAQTLLKMT